MEGRVVLAGVLVALAVIGLTAFVVNRLSGTTPAVIAAVLAAVATVLAAIPPIIKALPGPVKPGCVPGRTRHGRRVLASYRGKRHSLCGREGR
jgi:uncharacterized membrane protein YdfJ with MMPL/SSD domain